MKDIFTIAIQYEDTYIINIELIKSETENHLDIKLNLDTKCKEIKDRVLRYMILLLVILQKMNSYYS